MALCQIVAYQLGRDLTIATKITARNGLSNNENSHNKNNIIFTLMRLTS